MRKFIASVLICFSVSAVGSAVTLPSISTWYAHLNKAPFNPPNWLFGPVWTILYFLMAISLSLSWQKKAKTSFFFIQLFLNFFWSFAFFYLHQPLLALITIIALEITIVKTILDFSKKSPLAAYLLVPYIFWVAFATVLNLFVVVLN